MVLSFIVPAYNEEAELPATLTALRTAADAAGEAYEIIVVDDGSTDATAELAAAAGARVVPVHLRHIAAVRNAGANAAAGEILFFVDADTRISAEHVTDALAALRAGCAGGGARMELDEGVPFWGVVFARIFAAMYFAANLGAGAFLFTTRENFAKAGGFDEQYFAGEEVFFTKALKRIGRFQLLDRPMRTSGRKLRMHSPAKVLLGIFALAFAGPRALGTRTKLDFWYDGKREGKPA